MRIVLASKSPRRREILNKIGLKFEVADSRFEETYDETMAPENVVKYLAYNKAKYAADYLDKDALVIGADTVVVLDGEIMGKPKNAEDAFNMLKKLSGRWHSVYSGICVIDSSCGKYNCDFEVTNVKFKDLTDTEINSYIRSGEPFDKAGSYAAQGLGSLIVERIEGCYFNVVGLPVYKLSCILRDFGVNLLS